MELVEGDKMMELNREEVKSCLSKRIGELVKESGEVVSKGLVKHVLELYEVVNRKDKRLTVVVG